MILGKIGERVRIRIYERFRLVGGRHFSTNKKPDTELSNNRGKADGSLTHYDSYRDLDKLDFMTAAKILFTTPPKQKKFGLDFHLVQLFFVCLPSLAVYLVAQYARHEMKKMDAELERMKQAEEAKRIKAAEEETSKPNPQLLEVKERLDSLEKTVKEIVVESKNQRSRKVPEKPESDRSQSATTSKPAVEDGLDKPAPNGRSRVSGNQEAHHIDNQKGPGGLSHSEKN